MAKSMQPVSRGERTWNSSPELLYLAEECGHTKWVSEDERDTGMDSVECDAECPGRRTWRRVWVEK